MFAPDLEMRILKQAKDQGLLVPGEAMVPPPAEAASLWGTRLASLVAGGSLTQRTLESLAWDAIGGEAGSWADPLFQGPEPLGDLPGLGDRYRDLVLIGEGAMARVYKATDTLLQRPVALKVLKDTAGPAVAEARAQAQVEHPNVCRVYEVGKSHIVLQLVEGPTLARLAPTLSMERKLALVRDIALGVHAAHGRGLVHLDLKLNNVLLYQEEEGTLVPMVSDFGMVLAETAEAGFCPMGTPPYTSPEQLAGDPSKVDRRADVYALGVMLYVLLSGSIPFEAHDFPGLLEAMAHAPPVPLRRRNPTLPEDLSRLVHRCLGKRQEDRYPSAQALAEDLDRFLRHLPLGVMGKAPAYRLRMWRRRNRAVLRVAAVGLAVLVVAGVAGLRHVRYINEQAEWDHHFQVLVENLRGRLEHVWRQPTHDIGPELIQAREGIAALEAEMQRHGGAAQGPGHLAIGQALLLLDPDEPSASRHFQAAWDHGFRTQATRTWLVHTRIQEFNKELSALGQRPDTAAGAKLLAQLRDKYLGPATLLLTGREDPDQARLAHLAELASAQLQEKQDYARQLQIARSFRSRFPGEVSGILEEAGVLGKQAFKLWEERQGAAPTWPPSIPEVDSLRREARHLLQEALRVAPSQPRVYQALIESFGAEFSSPTQDTPPRALLQARVQDLATRGLQINRRDPALLLYYGVIVAVLGTELDLQNGQPTTRQLARIRAFFHLPGGPVAPGDRLPALTSLVLYLSACGSYGWTAIPEVEEDLRRLSQEADAGVESEQARMNASFRWITLGRYQLAAGQDPALALARGLRLWAAGPEPRQWGTGFLAKVTLARAALAQGKDPLPGLAEAEALLPRVDERDAFALGQELRIHLLRCQARGKAEDWSALVQCLERVQRGGGGPGDWSDVDAQLEGKLALLSRHADPQGPAKIRGIIQTALDSRQSPPHLLNERLAECCLLEARTAADPDAVLREGLEAAERALVYRTPNPHAPGGWVRPTGNGTWDPPHQDRTWVLKARLFLAQAERSGTAGGRRVRALQAEQALRQALARNRYLEPQISPWMEQARFLAGRPGNLGTGLPGAGA